MSPQRASRVCEVFFFSVWCRLSPAVRLFSNSLFRLTTGETPSLVLLVLLWGKSASHKGPIMQKVFSCHNVEMVTVRLMARKCPHVIVRRAGLLWSQQDFEWRWSVPLFKCLTVLEFSFILFDLCLLITFFNFIVNYVPIVTFWIFTYHKIWILSTMFCFIWSYWIIYFLACLEVSWRVVS